METSWNGYINIRKFLYAHIKLLEFLLWILFSFTLIGFFPVEVVKVLRCKEKFSSCMRLTERMNNLQLSLIFGYFYYPKN